MAPFQRRQPPDEQAFAEELGEAKPSDPGGNHERREAAEHRPRRIRDDEEREQGTRSRRTPRERKGERAVDNVRHADREEEGDRQGVEPAEPRGEHEHERADDQPSRAINPEQ